ncbi:MAG: Cation diffusion facilitator family transporter [Candidatus Saganbacteria bacterium]|uniref:Cation diffusion facilitator family transporter n=1 Tax=Candidatus Saganbacteria bacterium TaxID=2575572 RepID=A0A833L2C8_UNCSA|nr:MAG: Cation diffusion facilitator family transporter [Candidatus Saganbacteria bacterium]
MAPMDENFSKIKLVLWQILFLNWLVAAMKIFIGSVFGLISMVADGFHSLTDGASNIIGLVGLTAASKPVDSDHPYGHKKIESFTALGISMLLLIVCYEVIQSSISRIFSPQKPEASPLAFVVMIITFAINIFVVIYELRKGKEYKSDILVSDSMHTRSDIFVSSAVIVSLIGIRMGFPIVDPIASLIIVLMILYSAFRILMNIFGVLVDRAAVDRMKIEEIARSHPKVIVCHKVRTRGREDDIHVDLHISVDSNMSVLHSHGLSHELQENIKKEIAGVTDVIIHIEPWHKK